MGADLKTHYLGLELKNPVMAAAAPLVELADSALRMEDAGAAAVVMPSLFEESIRGEELEVISRLEEGADSHPEATSYAGDPGELKKGPEVYLENLARLKERLSIPVIASLNGTTQGGWMDFAGRIEEAGADALELNLYLPSLDPNRDAAAVEKEYLEIVTDVRKAVGIPLAIKLSPFFTSLPNMVRRLDQCGIDGLVLFHRFYQPDLDLSDMEIVSRLRLSTSTSLRQPLRWTSLLRDQTDLSLAVSGGVHQPEDVVKSLLVGADTTQVCSAMYRHGIQHLGRLIKGLEDWMEEHEYEAVVQMKGSYSRGNSENPHLLERSQYMRSLQGSPLTDDVDWTGVTTLPE